MRFTSLLLLSAASLCFSSCLVQRTVRDSSGQLIYQEPEIHTPFESEKKRLKEVRKKEEELGW
ncbi:MAG: hypothetical protein ABF391_15400 [Akkermansiaceae bacterium]